MVGDHFGEVWVFVGWEGLEEGLAERDRSPPPKLSEEAIEKLRSLGYTN